MNDTRKHTRHIDTRHKYVIEAVKLKEVNIQYVKSSDNRVEILTNGWRKGHTRTYEFHPWNGCTWREQHLIVSVSRWYQKIKSETADEIENAKMKEQMRSGSGNDNPSKNTDYSNHMKKSVWLTIETCFEDAQVDLEFESAKKKRKKKENQNDFCFWSLMFLLNNQSQILFLFFVLFCFCWGCCCFVWFPLKN